MYLTSVKDDLIRSGVFDTVDAEFLRENFVAGNVELTNVLTVSYIWI